MKALLMEGTDPNAYERGKSALWRASLKGHAGAVKLLLEAGADVDIIDWSGWSPLNESPKDHASRKRDLFKRYEKWEFRGSTPLYAACCGAHTEVVKLLLDAGPTVDKVDPVWNKCTPLYIACRTSGCAEIVKLLVAAG